MIVLLREGADPEAVDELREAVRGLGLTTLPLDGSKGRGFEVMGADRGRVLALRDSPAVEEILTRRRALAGGEPLWPHFALRVMILVVVLILLLGLLTAFFPPGLGDAAPGNAAEAPQHVEWHLRPLEGLLRTIPGGGLFFLLVWVGFIVWPFIDRTTENRRGLSRFLRWLGVAVAAFLVALGFGGMP